MKKFLIGIIALAACLPAFGQKVAGEKTFGPKVGYFSHNRSAIAGLTFTYAFSDHFRLAPEVGCVFRHHDQDAFVADLNAQFPFRFADNGAVALYPLAGLTFNSWGLHNHEHENDVLSHVNRFGANLGAGFELNCSETLRLNIEAKYSLMKTYSSVVLTAGISYVF